MPDSFHFSCPLCGQHAPVARVLDDGPFELQKYVKKLGGSSKLTEEMREARKFLGSQGRGSSPGLLNYERIEIDNELQQAVGNRISEISR